MVLGFQYVGVGCCGPGELDSLGLLESSLPSTRSLLRCVGDVYCA